MTRYRADHGFIIDTDTYAGNFERELCAFVTGRIGECDVGDEYAEMFKRDVGPPLQEVCDEPDEHGCHRPVAIFPTPGWSNDGMGGHYRDSADMNEVALKYRAECAKYVQRQIDQISAVKPGEANWTQELIDRELDRLQKAMEETKTKAPGQFHAYNSVIIFFDQPPTEDQIKLMVGRARQFVKIKGDVPWRDYTKINIEGFRTFQQTAMSDTAPIAT